MKHLYKHDTEKIKFYIIKKIIAADEFTKKIQI